MSRYHDRIADWARQSLQTVTNNTVALGQRLVTWLMVGNAGALAFSFNATVQGTGCDPAILQRASVAFTVGLGTGFVGAVISYMGSMKMVNELTRLYTAAEEGANAAHEISELRRLGEVVGQQHPLVATLTDAEDQLRSSRISRSAWAAVYVSLSFMIVSAVAFGWGMTEPLRMSEQAYKACAAGKPEKAMPAPARKASPS